MPVFSTGMETRLNTDTQLIRLTASKLCLEINVLIAEVLVPNKLNSMLVWLYKDRAVRTNLVNTFYVLWRTTFLYVSPQWRQSTTNISVVMTSSFSHISISRLSWLKSGSQSTDEIIVKTQDLSSDKQIYTLKMTGNINLGEQVH